MPAQRIVAVGLLLWSAVSLADPYDFRIYKLGNPTAPVLDDSGNVKVPAGFGYRPDANARFAAFAQSLAAGLTSVSLTPPETLGHSAFAINAELSVVNFDQGGVDIPTQRFNDLNSGIDGALLLPSIHVRKGLPWSFEVGARFSWVEKSAMAAATAEVKWALNEGFAYLPDLAIRGFVTRLFNSKDFSLAATGVDLGLGKKFAIGGMITLTPYAGWNPVFVGADSSMIDFNPGRPVAEAVANPIEDANHVPQTGRYDALSMGKDTMNNRFYGGLRFISGAFQLGAEYSSSRLPKVAGKSVPAVNAYNFSLGLDF